MTATLRLPRMLSGTVNTPGTIRVEGKTVAEAFADLFRQQPGLRNHILDDEGMIRAHVSVFVDGNQSGLDSAVGEGAQLRILHAVSGG